MQALAELSSMLKYSLVCRETLWTTHLKRGRIYCRGDNFPDVKFAALSSPCDFTADAIFAGDNVAKLSWQPCHDFRQTWDNTHTNDCWLWGRVRYVGQEWYESCGGIRTGGPGGANKRHTHILTGFTIARKTDLQRGTAVKYCRHASITYLQLG